MSRSSSSSSQAASAQPGSAGAAARASGTAVRARLFKEAIGPADDVFEREADRIADAVMRGDAPSAGGPRWSAASPANDTVRRKCAECEEEEEEKIRRAPKEGAPEPAAQASAEPTGGAVAEAPEAARAEAGPSLLSEDDAAAGPGRMPKSEFLGALRVEVCAAVDAALAGTGKDSQGCPWIDHWIGYYAERSATQVERSLQRYAPEARAAKDARGYIRAVRARVGRSAAIYAKTGRITGMPEDLPEEPAAGGVSLSGFGGMFFKARPGGPRALDPVSVRSRLGEGRAMPGDVRSRMESAFGVGFGRVRLHTDSDAGRVADGLNARAFTVGEHVAFSAGEYRPDSLVGQALLAHELAHVVQQGGGESLQRNARAGGEATSVLEEDADTTAVRAVVSIAGGARRSRQGLAKVARNAMPRLKSGLRLQRCGRHDPKPEAAPEIDTTEEALGGHAVSCMIRANKGPHTRTSGIWYPHDYQASYPDAWDKDYAKGYADSDYWERIATNQWRLKKGRSASAGVKAWLKGLTIAECYATAIVSEVDAVRAAIGDAKFDALYGSEDTAVSPRLELGAKGSNVLKNETLTHKTAGGLGTIGNRPATVGEWHYFYNHPKYLLKHPAGVYQGENAMLRSDKASNGDQLWEGLGQEKVTERQMYANMMADYNRPRDVWDDKRLDAIRRDNGGSLPAKYDLNSGIFPDPLNSYQEILDAPSYTIDGTTRKGGYNPGSRKGLDPQKVQDLKDTP
jgi:hypothetical protein